MPVIKKDIVVIGGGPAGYVSAIRAAQLGAEVALIEEKALGGTCLNVGCIPTKVLSKIAEHYSNILKFKEMGIHVGKVSLDFRTIQQRKQKVVETLKGGVNHLLNANGVEYFHGKAEVNTPGKVEVSLEKEKAYVVDTSKVIIATGSQPMELPDFPVDGEKILNSNDILELEDIPSSLLIVGGGVIGVEFASIFAQFGTDVNLVEILPDILPFCDEEVIAVLKNELSQKGVTINTSTRVAKVEKGKKDLRVTLEKDQKTWQLEVEKILVAAGRKPNVGIEGVNNLGLETRNGAIKVNEKMETNVPGIYAAGDVIGGYYLAHVAYHEGIVAAENCLGKRAKVDYRAVPQCIFTFPAVAGVGLTEKEAREKFRDLNIGAFPFSACGKAVAGGEDKGFVKIIAENEHNEILGVFIIGPAATELIHEATLAIGLEATLEEVADTIHAHPTLSESIGEAVLLAAKRPLHFA